MQFGTALQRIIQPLIYCDPSHGPRLLAKVDLANGYYHVPLSPEAALGLAVIIPSDSPAHPEPLIALPLALPMGWLQSLPFFCAYTETIMDMTNDKTTVPTQHPMVQQSQSIALSQPPYFHPQAIVLGTSKQPPLSYTDIYIDDFMVVAQQPNHIPTIDTLFHMIEAVFQDVPDSPRRQIISQSKLDKGDASFSVEKRILGWDFNTYTMTITLPPHRAQQLHDLLHNLCHQKQTSIKKWHHLLGVLRSTTPALYGAKHLF